MKIKLRQSKCKIFPCNGVGDHGNNGFAVVVGGDGWAFGQDNGNKVDHFLL